MNVDANNQKFKCHLLEKRGPNYLAISLKELHNLQTKSLKPQKDMENLLNEMSKISEAKIKIAVNDQDEVISIYFKDKRMSQIHELYQEMMLEDVDATYKLINRRMPLFLVLVIDGNGQSEIAKMI